jgi:hypothetical protein
MNSSTTKILRRICWGSEWEHEQPIRTMLRVLQIAKPINGTQV